MAAEGGYAIFASAADRRGAMQEAGIPVAGTLDDLLGTVDVMVDCTPKGIGARNKERYERAGVKAIFQGGESHDLTESVDCIRALTGIERDGAVSIEKTNAVLGIVKSFLPKTLGEEEAHRRMGEASRDDERAFMAEGFKGAEESAEPEPTLAQRPR